MPMAPKVLRQATTSNDAQLPPKCYLDKLPLEIIAEILLGTASPRDILAVARCNKFFCATLVNNPATVYIWKTLRQKFDKIPDPTPNWTESSYAAFLFDDGICEVCRKTLKAYPFSFSVRLYLCEPTPSHMLSTNHCQATWFEDHALQLTPTNVHPRYRHLVATIPHIEHPNQAFDPVLRVRRSDWLSIENALNKASIEGRVDVFLANGKQQTQRIVDIQSHCGNLISWRKRRKEDKLKVKEANDKFAKSIARVEGWIFWDMKMSPSFATLLRCKSISLERITKADIESIRPVLEAEIIRIRERRVRQTEEGQYARVRAAVVKHYRALIAGGKVVPPLGDFKQFHTAQMVLKQPSAVRMFFSTQLNQPLTEEVDRWVRNARNVLGKVLGFADWKSANNTLVHIAERVNARFLCVKCQKSGGVTHWDDKGLTFREACRHTCPHLTKSQRAKVQWSGDNFVADVHGMSATNQVLSKAGIDAGRNDASTRLLDLESRIVCRICPTPIVMDFPSVTRHSRRHAVVNFDVISREDANVILKGISVAAGLTERLRCQREILYDKRMFSCRHCVSVGEVDSELPSESDSVTVSGLSASGVNDSSMNHETARERRQDTAAAATVGTASGSVQASSQADVPAKTNKALLRQKRRKEEKASARYTFNGMRSHVKAKHGIARIGDEDFYQVPEESFDAVSATS